MSPRDNSDVALSIYADWLEDSGYPDQSEEVRDGILAERTAPVWCYITGTRTGWIDESDTGNVGPNNHAHANVGSFGADFVGSPIYVGNKAGIDINSHHLRRRGGHVGGECYYG